MDLVFINSQNSSQENLIHLEEILVHNESAFQNSM